MAQTVFSSQTVVQPDSIPEPLCWAHLERIVSGATFSRSDQLRRLLSWLGERSIGNSHNPPSEKEIAEAVLNRRDFDPQSDSLVRKEMSRLREKLARFYALEGAREDLRIVATGGYQLSFKWRTAVYPVGERSCWLVLPFRTQPDMATLSEEVLEDLLIRLSKQEYMDLVSPTTALGYRGRSGDIRQFAAECRAHMVVEGSLRQRGDSVCASVWLVSGQNGITQISTKIVGENAADIAESVSKWLMETGNALCVPGTSKSSANFEPQTRVAHMNFVA